MPMNSSCTHMGWFLSKRFAWHQVQFCLMFSFETLQNYNYFTATAQVWVTIADKNDNTPYFEKTLYEQDVEEQGPDTSKAIVTVKAQDIDDGMHRNVAIIC